MRQRDRPPEIRGERATARLTKEQRQIVRARLLQSAAIQFAEHGLSGANINRISTEAGYAKGTVYNYFASKEELFSSVLALGSRAAVEHFRASATEDDLRAKLLSLVGKDVALGRKHQAFLKVIIRESLSPDAKTQASVANGVEPLKRVLVELFDVAQSEGTLRSDLSGHQLAIILLGQMTVLYNETLRSQGAWPTWNELPRVIVDQFLDGAIRV